MPEAKIPPSKDYCTQCHTHELYNGSKYCSQCGRRLVVKPKPECCPDCGRPYQTTDKYCTGCRRKRIIRTPVPMKE